MIDQRKTSRQKTLLGARISVEAFADWSVDCTVKNLGQGGARIALPARATIPDSFTLAIPSRTTEAARLVWHRDGIVGVTFATDEPVAEQAVSEPCVVTSTHLERRIAAIANRGPVGVVPFERRARSATSLRG